MEEKKNKREQTEENGILATLVGWQFQELWLMHNAKTCYFLEILGISLLFCEKHIDVMEMQLHIQTQSQV